MKVKMKGEVDFLANFPIDTSLKKKVFRSEKVEKYRLGSYVYSTKRIKDFWEVSLILSSEDTLGLWFEYYNRYWLHPGPVHV